ncbi:MAG: hypothetical protein JWN91_724 [Nocardioides sp.]|nr:hypothetical protein [Nocardioides sp.]
MLTRRALLGTSATAAAALGLNADVAPALARTPVATFVSTPDFFNGDVGDLRVLPNYDGGPNSVNSSWLAAIDKCLAAVAAHQPDAVFVGGDLVEGRWNLDNTGRQLFGPVSQGRDARSIADCESAVQRAGDVYYGFWGNLFSSRGLTVYPAVGDHELLDDRPAPDQNDAWSPSGRYLAGHEKGEKDNRYFLVPTCKDAWSRHFTTVGGKPRFANRPVGTATGKTAYAVDIGPKLTLITVDVFQHNDDGVRLGVFGGQLSWLRRNIRAAKKAGRIVIVQGHIPIIMPVRNVSSGMLHVPEGMQSKLYAALEEEGADFYFCGEVHDTTVHQDGSNSVVQISHGSIFRYAFNYLVGNVYADGTTTLDYYEMSVEAASAEQTLWSTDRRKWQRTELVYGDPVRRGRIVTRNRELIKHTAKLGTYHPADDPWKYEGTLHPETVI